MTTALSSKHELKDFRKNYLLHALLGLFVTVWVCTAISPLYRQDWLLENLLVFICVPLMVFSYKRMALSDLSWFFITVYLLLHTFGAHYTYSEVPFGYWLQDVFAQERNSYDRLVHFSFGLLLAYPFSEFLMRHTSFSKGWVFYVPVEAVLALSGLFEIIEMCASGFVSHDLGDSYLGIQGDKWDAQKDMALATAGAIITMFLTWVIRKRSRKNKINNNNLPGT